MTQKHVDLLMEAVNLDSNDIFLCNRVEYLTGIAYTYPSIHNTIYVEKDGRELIGLIQRNIEDNFFDPLFKAGEGLTFTSTTFSQAGMTRKEWAETILAPLALELPEDN